MVDHGGTRSNAGAERIKSPMKQRSQSGLTLVETTVTLFFTMLVFGIYARSVVDSVEFSAANIGGASLHEIGRRTLETVARDLSRTGNRIDPVWGIPFPHVFRNGLPDPILSGAWEHDTEQLEEMAAAFPPGPPPPPEPSNPPPFVAPGFELTPMGIREIVFRLPADLDGDGRLLNASNQLEWHPDTFGYIMIPNHRGTLNLVRRTVTAQHVITDQTICTNVEALTFDSVETKSILPLDAIEVHLHLKRQDVRGRIQRLHLTTTMVMRNSP